MDIEIERRSKIKCYDKNNLVQKDQCIIVTAQY